MLPRFVAATVAVALAVGLAACQPEPEPSPTGPVFASEEEAFAAAEETYRAYVDALNQVDLSDPETFEAVYAWTTGELNATDRQGLSAYHADGVTVSGASKIQRADLASWEEDGGSVTLAVCLDVSDVQVIDAAGSSLVAPDRTDVQSLLVSQVVAPESPTSLRIELIGPREGEPSCTD